MFLVVLMTAFFHIAATQECPPGTFLYTVIHSGQHFCIECQDGTFMPYKDHQQTSCRPCEKIKDTELEILISPCNKTDDAVIHCVDGYYRDEARNPRETGQCKKCTECPAFTGKSCSTYRDTVCCWDENFDVVLDLLGVPVCRERPWFCRRGQYFDTSGFQCLPCPENTFMPLDFHIQTECLKCRENHHKSYQPLHSVVIQPCNRTHAPVIRCEDGFFMNPKMSYTDDALGCSPCTDCSTTDVQYEGRKCDGMEDTVCCLQPNMTVVDTPDGSVCVAPSTRCKDSQCLHYNIKNKSATCSDCLTSDGSLENHEINSPPPHQVHLTSAVEPHRDCSHNGQRTSVEPHYYNSCPNVLVIPVLLGAVTAVIVFTCKIASRIWKPVLHMCKTILEQLELKCHGISALFKTDKSKNVRPDDEKSSNPLRKDEESGGSESPSMNGRHWAAKGNINTVD